MCPLPPDREFPGDVDAVRDADPPVSCDTPNLEETSQTVKQLKSGKAPGGCSIYAEMFRAGEPPPFCGCTLCCVPFGHGDHPDRLETERCRFDLEGKG